MTNWLTGWGFRKSHIITASAGAGTNYQTCIKVYKTTGTDGTETVNGVTAGKVYVGSNCRNDFGDIRFTDNDGDTLLDCWMEELSSGVYAIFWVEVADTLESNATIYVYYSKSDATYPYLATVLAQGEATFRFFDDFLAANIDWTNKWQSTKQTNFSIESGALKIVMGTTDTELINTKNSYGDGYASSALIRAATSGKRVLNMNNDIPATWRDKDAGRVLWVIGKLQCALNGTPSELVESQDLTNYYKSKIYCPASGDATVTLLKAGVVKLTRTAAPAYRTVYVSFSTWDGTGYVDDVYVRKYVSPEPAHSTWGTEEVPAVAHSLTITEIIGCVDSKSRNKTINRTYSELLGLTDSKSRIKSYFRTITELLGLKDSKSRVKSYYRTITELLGLKDLSKSWIHGKFLTIIEIIGLKDSKSRVKSIHRTITEKLGLKETRSRSKTISRVITELIGMKDAVTKVAWHWSLPPVPPVITAAVGKIKHVLLDKFLGWLEQPAEDNPRVQCDVKVSWTQTNRVASSIKDLFTETVTIRGKLAHVFTETMPITAALLHEFTESVQIRGSIIQKFEETVHITGDLMKAVIEDGLKVFGEVTPLLEKLRELKRRIEEN